MVEEQVVQQLPRRCPYCDEVLPQEVGSDKDVKEERCPHCGKVFVRMPLKEAAKMVKNR
ncbi:MAG: hypothetical protein JRJ48_01790 [Deltaproteobacteria bacterium]|nr:hypothetical protein [Deltaproteobacteria bacterium]